MRVGVKKKKKRKNIGNARPVLGLVNNQGVPPERSISFILPFALLAFLENHLHYEKFIALAFRILATEKVSFPSFCTGHLSFFFLSFVC